MRRRTRRAKSVSCWDVRRRSLEEASFLAPVVGAYDCDGAIESISAGKWQMTTEPVSREEMLAVFLGGEHYMASLNRGRGIYEISQRMIDAYMNGEISLLEFEEHVKATEPPRK